MNRKIFFWALYDFANSVIIANLTLYLSQWVIVDKGFQDIWYAISLVLSTVLLILTAPFLGSYSDRTRKRMHIIVPLTILIGISTISLGIIGASSMPKVSRVIIVLILSVVIQYAYQLSLVLYDTLLPLLTTKQHFGKISGIGDGLGNLGFLLGLFITFPFINGTVTITGEPGRIQAFIPSGILFLLLSAPMLLTIRDMDSTGLPSPVLNFRHVLKGLRDVLKDRNILWFLAAFYFVSDAVLTIQSFFPIYFQQALGFSDMQKLIATSIVLIFIVIGAVMLGRFSDRRGLKNTLIISTSVLTLLLAVFPFISTAAHVYLFLPIVGVFWGGFYAISRALLTRLSPPEKRGEFFSLYTIFRRFASIVGPLLWSLTVLILAPLGNGKYRISMYPLIVLMALGVLMFRKIRSTE